MIELRGYQKKTIEDLYTWMRKNEGNPCIVLPTGAGKSIIIAELCRDALQNWPETKILKLTHSRELIAQNAQKLKMIWPNAPLGVYSAGIGKRELGEPITFGGIQSLRGKAGDLGHIDICIIDEAHLINHRDEGGYRELLRELKEVNPAMRIVGLTATPFRLGHGLITDEPAIFDDLIEPVTIPVLQHLGFLADMRSKSTTTGYDLTGVHKRGGDYIESELQEAVDTALKNEEVVDEVIRRAGDRRHWMFFCTGVDHARHIKEVLISRGITAEVVTGDTPKAERDRILEDYKAGKIMALSNVDVLTTGFDYPDIDIIAMLRPTLSPGLYVQAAGRGLRLKSHTDHCLFLDFAGVVELHGPITAVKPPKKGTKGDGVAPSKICPECEEIVAISAKVCPACGYEFTVEKETSYRLRDDDIMGRDEKIYTMEIEGWNWRIETSRTSGKEMVVVRYEGKALSDPPIKEFFCVFHGGYVAQKAQAEILGIAKKAGCPEMDTDALTKSPAPARIRYKMDGKFFKVVAREWDEEIPF